MNTLVLLFNFENNIVHFKKSNTTYESECTVGRIDRA